MSRWFWLTICAILGVVMLICGLLMPAHLRAVDASVVQRAGKRGPALVERGLALAGEKNLGAAQMLWQAAQAAEAPGRETLGAAISNVAAPHPGWLVLGSPDPALERVMTEPGAAAGREVPSTSEAFTSLFVRQGNRERALAWLGASKQAVVQELLRCRALTNTVIFPPPGSGSSQPFDAAVAVCGLLLEERRLAPGLSNAFYGLAAVANYGKSAPAGATPAANTPRSNTQLLEQVLLDVLSLGQRFDWSQLCEFTRQIEDTETLRLLAIQVRKAGRQMPLLYSAVVLSGQPAEVTRYLMNFSQSGLADLGASLTSGAGGVKELLERNQRWYRWTLRERLAGQGGFKEFFEATLDYCWLTPWLALGVKWLLYLGSGFLLAAAMHFGRPAVPALEEPLQVRGFVVARELLFALGFLLAVLLLSEPFLSQGNQKVDFPFRLRLPVLGRVVPAAITNVKEPIMNQETLLTMLLFLCLQAMLYTACLLKLAEIRRQRVPARMKLKLLENEDHLFDAGLYLGFVGTIISFMLVLVKVIPQASLMAAYSSTSFGIIFVSIFKIFHVRPLRRRYLLEAEAAAAAEAETVAPSAAVPLPSAS